MPSSKIIAKVKNCIEQGKPFVVTTFKLPYETETQIMEIAEVLMKEVGLEPLAQHIIYCLRELGTNAKKANTKRIYFEDEGLDINNPEDYKKGMEGFKTDTLSNIDYYLDKQKEAGLYIKFSFQVIGQELKIVIRNNVEISRKEQMRVYDRIVRARSYNSMEEAFSEILDDSEGAGLGLTIMVLTLRSFGLSSDAFDIEGINGETITSLTIPVSGLKEQEMNELIDMMLKEISVLPQFPENIAAVQELLKNSEAEISDIAKRISMDATMTADLLKTVNSAQFMLDRKVDNIGEAVMLVGLKGIKNILYSYGIESLLALPEKKELWHHSYQTAFYSYSLARNLTKNKDVINEAYVGGILHDIGKIIFSKVHPDLIENIKVFTDRKGFSSGFFEKIAGGFNHAEIGAQISSRWNLPEALSDTIKFHHNPMACKTENRLPVYCVHLANAIAHYQDGSYEMYMISSEILRLFRINNEEDFLHLSEQLLLDYKEELKNNPLEINAENTEKNEIATTEK